MLLSGKWLLKIQFTSFYEGKAINIESGLFTKGFAFRMRFCVKDA